MSTTTLTHNQQRSKTEQKVIASINLEMLLRDLIRKVMVGNKEAIMEFQQQIQYAPPEMKDRIASYLQNLYLPCGRE